MGMKFSGHKYWRHDRMRDVFFCVDSEEIAPNGEDIVLNGSWCTQTPQSWFFTKRDRVTVFLHESRSWYPYTPFGDAKL